MDSRQVCQFVIPSKLPLTGYLTIFSLYCLESIKKILLLVSSKQPYVHSVSRAHPQLIFKLVIQEMHYILALNS